VVTASVDLLTGSAAAGMAAALSAFVAVLSAITGSFRDSGARDALFKEATEPYLRWGVNAWSFANAKVRHDPIYFDILRNPRLARFPGGDAGPTPEGDAQVPADHGVLLDLGCGQGFVLSCLATAREWARRGEWPREWSGGPGALTLYGIEHRDYIADQARSALGGRATVVTGDIRTAPIPPCAAAVCLDVLHLIGYDDQEAIVRRVAAALDAGGLMLLREADKGAGWRFQMVRWGNLLTAMTQLDPRRRFYFRSADEWAALVTRCGLAATVRPMGEGTPFANVLVEGVKTSR
jgi:SAM-dependent methyltransferase